MPFILVLLVLVLPCSSMAQYTMDHYHPQHIVDSLGIQKLYIYKVKGQDSVLHSEWQYDSAGREVAHIEHISETSTFYTYNTQGQLVREYWSPHDYDFETKDTFIYENGMLVEERDYNEKAELTGTYKYTYVDGKLSERKYIGKSYESVTKNYYSPEGWLDSTHRYSEGSLQYIEIWRRNAQGQMTGFVSLKGNREVVNMQEFHYNSDGLEKQQVVLNTDNLKPTQMYKSFYDERKLLRYIERYTAIKNGDLSTADYEKRVYVYE